MGRMVRGYVMLFLQAMAMCISGSVHAADADTLISQLPRTYAGTYQWRDSVRIYKVTLQFTDVRVLDTGRVEATGAGIYDAYGEISKVNIRAVIDPDDLFLEIWEYDPAIDGSELDGLYRGNLSTDMQSITAMWRGFSDKSRGYLKLSVKP